MNTCLCGRSFETERSFRTHKRFCKQWREHNALVHANHLSHEERKEISVACPLCDRKFVNVYSMSAHKGHCLGVSSTKQFDGKRASNKGRVMYDLMLVPFETLPQARKRQRVRQEANNACERCGFNETRTDGKSIIHVDHIDGNRKNNHRSNLRALCPNCHWLTETFGFYGRKHNRRRTKKIRDT